MTTGGITNSNTQKFSFNSEDSKSALKCVFGLMVMELEFLPQKVAQPSGWALLYHTVCMEGTESKLLFVSDALTNFPRLPLLIIP